MDAISLSLPTGDAQAEAAHQQLEAAALAKTATEAMKFAEEAMAAAAMEKLAVETAAKQKQEIETTAKCEAAEAVKQRVVMALSEEASIQQKRVDDRVSTGSGGIK